MNLKFILGKISLIQLRGNRFLFAENKKLHEENHRLFAENKKLHEENHRLFAENKKLHEENHRVYQPADKVDLGYQLFTHLTREIKTIRTPLWIKSRHPKSHLKFNDFDPIPDVFFRKRIAGHLVNDDPSGEIFLSKGYEMAKQIMNIFEVYTNEKLDNLAILDWGVGCSRILRHFKETSSNLMGIDIDPINVDWNKKNLGDLSFLNVEPNQIFKSNKKFDLVYSFSVTSHLSLEDSLFWLENLAKSCSGLMIISTHGLRNTFEYDWSKNPIDVLNWLQNGIVGGGNNPDILDIAPMNYYGDYALSYSHILENWSKVVEILDIIPLGLESHDAIICAAKKS